MLYGVCALFCVLTIYATYSKIEERDALYYNKIAGNPFIKEHYQSEFDRKKVKKAIALIPHDASVSALTYFAPHISFRKNIYQFPDVHDAEYIFIARSAQPYPLTKEQMDEHINLYLTSPGWQTVFYDEKIFLFKKKQ